MYNILKKFSLNKKYSLSLTSIILGKICFLAYMVLLENLFSKEEFSQILLFSSIQVSFIFFATIGADEIYIKNYNRASKLKITFLFLFKIICLILLFFFILYFIIIYLSNNKNIFLFTVENYDIIIISTLCFFICSITRIDNKSFFYLFIENIFKNFLILLAIILLIHSINLDNFAKSLRYIYIIQLFISSVYFLYILINKNIENEIKSIPNFNLKKNFIFTFLRNSYAFSTSGFDILIISLIGYELLLPDYRIASIAAGIFAIFLTSINTIILPEYSSKIQSNDTINIGNDYNNSSHFIAIISLPIFILSIFTYEYFLNTLFKYDYSYSTLIFKFLVTSQFISVLMGPTQYLIFLFDKNFQLIKVYIYFIILNIIIFYLSLKFAGILGLAIAILISNLFFRIVNIIILKKINFNLLNKNRIIILFIYSIFLILSLII